MPTPSAQPSFARKSINWMKDHPLVMAAIGVAILATAGFLTAGFLVPIVLGAWGVLAGLVAGGIALAALAGLCSVYGPESASDDDEVHPKNPLGWGFTGGAFLGGILSIAFPPVGLVGLSLLIGAAVYGLTVGIAVGFNKLFGKKNPSVDPPTIASSTAACHDTFGSKPEMKQANTPSFTPSSTNPFQHDPAVVVNPDTTLQQRPPAFNSEVKSELKQKLL